MKKAFTLAEVLITLALIGVISSIIIPALMNSLPNNNKYLYRAAYRTVEQVLSDLINNGSLYSDALNNGFKNTTDATYFCDNFTNEVNLINSTDCANVRTPSANPTVPNFTTSNGMRWWGFVNTFATTANIWVDVDGANKGKNTISSDILRINIQQLGKIIITDCPENKFLTDNSVTSCP
ncbi:MAG: type II secretion system protein [Candidatus Gastranaerophilaceae bacterium]|jgi:prepilin-type N-terminal cleavage/methylation domain-containing protein